MPSRRRKYRFRARNKGRTHTIQIGKKVISAGKRGTVKGGSLADKVRLDKVKDSGNTVLTNTGEYRVQYQKELRR